MPRKKALTSEKTRKIRPYQPGASISSLNPAYKHAGTLGFIAKKTRYYLGSVAIPYGLARLFSQKLKEKFFTKKQVWVGVSNYHVAEGVGKLVVQPGSLDGGDENDVIGTVVEASDLKSGVLDVSVFELNDQPFKTEILSLGRIKGVKNSRVGELVRKSGRTSGITSGLVVNDSVNIMVDYGSDGMIFFKDVVMVSGPFLKPGDSGSAVIDKENNLVGLGFAGSEQYGFFLKAEKVLNELELEIPKEV